MKFVKYLYFFICVSLSFSQNANAGDYGYYRDGSYEFYSCNGKVYSTKLFNDLVKDKTLPADFISQLESGNKSFGTNFLSQFGVASDDNIILVKHVSGCFKSSSSFMVYEKRFENDSDNWHLELVKQGELPPFSGNSFRESMKSFCLKLK